jgi:hypothetical protein
VRLFLTTKNTQKDTELGDVVSAMNLFGQIASIAVVAIEENTT